MYMRLGVNEILVDDKEIIKQSFLFEMNFSLTLHNTKNNVGEKGILFSFDAKVMKYTL